MTVNPQDNQLNIPSAWDVVPKPVTSVDVNGYLYNVVNAIRAYSGFLYSWDTVWHIRHVKWYDTWDTPEELCIFLTRRKCHIWNDDVARIKAGWTSAVQMSEEHVLMYNPTINGFNNSVLKVVQPTSKVHTFVYIQVR